MANEMAGSRLISYFLTDPMGEEILEGVVGGGMAGLSQVGTGATLGEIALKTASAIAGGIGMGMLGRRLGARVGRRIHKDPLENQEGMLATIGRTVGSKTTAEGLRDQGKVYKSAVQEGLMQDTSSTMRRQAAKDPVGFAQKYGISAEEFQRVENAIARQASGSMDEVISRLANDPDMEDLETMIWAQKMLGSKENVSNALKELITPTPLVTGEHVGRATGRFLGDEIGILGGLVVGDMAARGLGMEDPRESRIGELERQLAGRK